MRNKVLVVEGSRNFAAYVDRVVQRKEEFAFVLDGEIVAELRPVQHGRKLGELPGLMHSLPRLSSEDAEDFAWDLAEIRNSMFPR